MSARRLLRLWIRSRGKLLMMMKGDETPLNKHPQTSNTVDPQTHLVLVLVLVRRCLCGRVSKDLPEMKESRQKSR